MAVTNAHLSLSSLDHYGRRRVLQVLITLAAATAIYFLAAGSITAPWGWVYLILSLVTFAFGAIYILKRNPGAINERGRPAEGQKRWDKTLLLIYVIFSVGFYIVAGLSYRFVWTAVPLWLHLLGAAVTVLTSALTYAAMANNKFLYMYVQVTEKRGHQIASSGPYCYVRHPMYVALVLSWPALALLLGSYWALIPGLVASGLIILRTALEDRTLRAELAGYSDYARQVPYRLLPGVW